jgi:hypothetical protein
MIYQLKLLEEKPVKKIKSMRLRNKLLIFILPLLALFLLVVFYMFNFLENEMLFRLAEHNRYLNHTNASQTNNVLNEMQNAIDATLFVDSPTRLSEIQLLVTQLVTYEGAHMTFPNVANFWRFILVNSSYIYTISIASYDGAAVYMTNQISPFLFLSVTKKLTKQHVG